MLNTIAGLLGVGAPPTDFESIATTTVGAGGSSTITFTSIPATYSHLQLRGIARNNNSADDSFALTFNSDTGTNYSRHGLTGSGTAAASYAGSTVANVGIWAISAIANTFGAAVIDVLDYANTNKYKTIRSLNGYDNNGSGYIVLTSGNWRNTAAITSITLTANAGTFQQYSSFALYGIK